MEILDYLGVADCGTVIHPQGLAAQVRGGAVMGFGMALTERHVYDSRWGLPAAVGLHHAKPPSYLDVPVEMDWAAVDIADPHNPVGAKGVGEPLMGCAAAAVLCAIRAGRPLLHPQSGGGRHDRQLGGAASPVHPSPRHQHPVGEAR